MKPCLLLIFVAVSALADTVTFDTQAASSGSDLTGIANSPLTIGILTVTGGELLNQETGLGADQTGVYASEGLFGNTEANPVVLTFSRPVNNFSLFIANGDDTRAYTVADNFGGSATLTLASAGALGGATFSLSDSAITSVTITSANSAAWNFAVDNVSFTPVPEASSGALCLVGLLAALCCRKNQRW